MIRAVRNALKVLNQFKKKQIGCKINDIQVEIPCLPSIEFIKLK